MRSRILVQLDDCYDNNTEWVTNYNIYMQKYATEVEKLVLITYFKYRPEKLSDLALIVDKNTGSVSQCINNILIRVPRVPFLLERECFRQNNISLLDAILNDKAIKLDSQSRCFLKKCINANINTIDDIVQKHKAGFSFKTIMNGYKDSMLITLLDNLSAIEKYKNIIPKYKFYLCLHNSNKYLSQVNNSLVISEDLSCKPLYFHKKSEMYDLMKQHSDYTVRKFRFVLVL